MDLALCELTKAHAASLQQSREPNLCKSHKAASSDFAVASLLRNKHAVDSNLLFMSVKLHSNLFLLEDP